MFCFRIFQTHQKYKIVTFVGYSMSWENARSFIVLTPTGTSLLMLTQINCIANESFHRKLSHPTTSTNKTLFKVQLRTLYSGYCIEQGIVQYRILRHCMQERGNLRKPALVFIAHACKIPCSCSFYAKKVGLQPRSGVRIALSKQENSYIDALVMVCGLRLMILTLVTPHCVRQSMSRYTTA